MTRGMAAAFASYSAWYSKACAYAGHNGTEPPEWNPPQLKRAPGGGAAYRRPSDGQPSGAPFDVEEYLVRKADRRASDPEFQRRLKARREHTRSFWEKRKDEAAHRDANAALAGELTCQPSERSRKIWQAVKDAEQVAFVDRVYLDQPSRIFNAKHNRVRGCGAAARRAGFAD